MELILNRTYFPKGSNGVLYADGHFICYTIELPWKVNVKHISCIPEGKYQLEKRYSKKFGWHLLVKGVPGRSLILFHPANNALEELRGCIAPVTNITAPGRGLESKVAFKQLKQKVYASLTKRAPVYLTIKKNNYEFDTEGKCAHP